MTFWAPEKGVTTPNSNYARSELREMNSDGSSADWHLAGSHQLQATLRVVSVTDHVCVGQIHLGTGGSSTKPLVELYYYKNGNIVLGVENSPSGGQTTHQIANVPVGTQFSYTIAVTGGNTVGADGEREDDEVPDPVVVQQVQHVLQGRFVQPVLVEQHDEGGAGRLLRADGAPQLTAGSG